MTNVVKQVSHNGQLVAMLNADVDEVFAFSPLTGRSSKPGRLLSAFPGGSTIVVNANKLDTRSWLYKPSGIKVSNEWKLDLAGTTWVSKETSLDNLYVAISEQTGDGVTIYSYVKERLSRLGSLFSVVDDYLVVNAPRFGLKSWLYKVER